MTVAARMGAGQGGEGLVAGMRFDGGATRVLREEDSQGRAGCVGCVLDVHGHPVRRAPSVWSLRAARINAGVISTQTQWGC